MIVELIGSSGAGKTTLVRRLARGAGAGAVVSATDLIMDRPGRRWVRNPKVSNLVADATVLPSFLRGRDREFVRFAFDRVRRHAPSRFAKVNYLREIVRDVGTHELARRAAAGRTVLVDEGAVLTAYHLFVYSDAPFDRVDLDRFAELVPLPDGIVHVTAPLDVLVDRAMRRPDRRRELASDDRADVERLLARAVEVFDGLVASPRIRERTLVVDTADLTPAAQAAVVERVTAFIEDRAAALGDPPAPRGGSPASPGASRS